MASTTAPPIRSVDGPERLMTYQEIAEAMAISPRTLQRAAAAGELPVVRFGHRTVRIRQQDLELWIVSKYKSHQESFPPHRIE